MVECDPNSTMTFKRPDGQKVVVIADGSRQQASKVRRFLKKEGEVEVFFSQNGEPRTFKFNVE